MDLDLEDIS
jgi:hypothetical protein